MALISGCTPPNTRLVGHVDFTNSETATTYRYELPEDCSIFDKTDGECSEVSTLVIKSENQNELQIIFEKDNVTDVTLSIDQISKLRLLDASVPCDTQQVCKIDLVGGSEQFAEWKLIIRSGNVEKELPAIGGKLSVIEVGYENER